MLSEKLNNLSARLAALAAAGQPMPPAAAAIVADVLRECAASATTLEDQPIPPLKRGGVVTLVHGGRAA